MGRHPHRETLIWATICVWSAVGILATTRYKLAARAGISLTVSAKPSSVRLSIDGDRYEGGAYFDTPLKLSLRSGRHRLKIARDGFISHVVTVEGDSGEVFHLDEVILARNTALSFATVSIATDEAPVHVDIDDGLVHGETPLTATDVIANQPHMLTVFPKWPNKDSKAHCRFIAKPDDGNHPLLVKVRLKAGKVRFFGCDQNAKHR